MMPRVERPPLPLHLQSRDRDILKHLFTYRLLTSAQVQQLTPGSPQQLLRRLQKLTEHGYVIRHTRMTAHQPYIYQLGRRAGEELTPYYGIEIERAHKRAKKISGAMVAHAMMIARFHVTLSLALRERSDIELVDWALEDEIPLRKVTYQDGIRLIDTSFKPDALFILKYRGAFLTCFFEADRSTEASGVFVVKAKAYWHFWQQEREKMRRGEKSLGPFRVLWITKSTERMENLRLRCGDINIGRGIDLHWFAVETSCDNPAQIFLPIWKTGRTGDDALHGLLESRERERTEG